MSGWVCEDCGWPWPLSGEPPVGAECDSCGGPLIEEVNDDTLAAALEDSR